MLTNKVIVFLCLFVFVYLSDNVAFVLTCLAQKLVEMFIGLYLQFQLFKRGWLVYLLLLFVFVSMIDLWEETTSMGIFLTNPYIYSHNSC